MIRLSRHSQRAKHSWMDCAESGFIEGQNILIDWKFTRGRSDRAAESAAALVRLQMDAIVASGGFNVFAGNARLRKYRSVMLDITDPVGQGLVASLAQPGGNPHRCNPGSRRKLLPSDCNYSRMPFLGFHVWLSSQIRTRKSQTLNRKRSKKRGNFFA